MMSSSKPTFEATFPDGEFKGTLKIGNDTIFVYIAEMSASTDMVNYLTAHKIGRNLYEKLHKRTVTKRKFILIEE